MKLLYTHPNRLLVENARNIVENAGIQTELRNEFAGGAIGELAPIEAWPEIWVRDSSFEAARKLIEFAYSDNRSSDWTCPGCGEQNTASFEHCWKCQHERPA
ncbi:putative signal transducing protein [Gilvimarinus sp. F26214L]|uniref:putative signal transducing protein n=1 Tax=Gilvimarinus sp. DZF01 TaxID=3461371 RepID=UPI0040462414